MLTEALMGIQGWTEIWCGLHDSQVAYPSGYKPRWWHVYHKSAFMVGIWTGPERDLLCVKPCTTNQEANEWLSPPARTIFGAVLGSAWKRYTGTYLQLSDAVHP